MCMVSGAVDPNPNVSQHTWLADPYESGREDAGARTHLIRVALISLSVHIGRTSPQCYAYNLVAARPSLCTSELVAPCR